jgi:hypothetical protein
MVISIQVFGGLPFDALDLSLLELGCDRIDDADVT